MPEEAIRAPKRRRRARHEPAAHDAIMDGIEDDRGSASDDDCSSQAESSSSSSSSSSSTSSAAAPVGHGSASSGAPGLGAGETEEHRPSAAVLADEPESYAVAVVGTRRNMYVAFPFGACRLTPRTNARGDVSAYQLTCTHPAHNSGTRCTKTVSVAKHGEGITLRMLKAWTVKGYSAASKAAHQDLWKEVVDSVAAGTLQADRDLEASAVADWGRLHPMRGSSDAGFEGASPPAQGAEGQDPLGGAAPEVPPDVHARMLSMFAAGGLPQSSQEQRSRFSKTSGSKYAVPEGLTEAWRFHYVHPNIPPPRGMEWKATGGVLRLRPRAG